MVKINLTPLEPRDFPFASDSARMRFGGAASQYISGGPFVNTPKSRGGNDELESRGGGDAVIGGFDRDTASYAHAPAAVTASLANPAGNSGDATGDSYSSIENLAGSRFADRLTATISSTA